MKLPKFFLNAAAIVAVTAPFSQAYANPALEECLQRASDQYNEQMQRCLTTSPGIWGDPAERDYCQYSAGLEHDSNIQWCYISYADGSSGLNRILRREGEQRLG